MRDIKWAQYVENIFDGTNVPSLTPMCRERLPGIYKNLRSDAASSEHPIYDVLLRRMERGEPVDWNSVEREGGGQIQMDADTYRLVLSRMLDKDWIVSSKGTEIGQPDIPPNISAVMNGTMHVTIAQQKRIDTYRESIRLELPNEVKRVEEFTCEAMEVLVCDRISRNEPIDAVTLRTLILSPVDIGIEINGSQLVTLNQQFADQWITEECMSFLAMKIDDGSLVISA